MDVYGYLLFSSATGETELNKLAVDLMGFETTPVQRSQAWAVAALYSERKGDPEKAMLFIENAVRCNPHSAFTYRLKGLLLLNNNNLEQAVVSFRQANMVTKEIETYAGLVKVDRHIPDIIQRSNS
jgi:tetratricopeptide (TPR) repeat protein